MTEKACLTHVPLVHRDSLALRYLALIDIQPTLAAQGRQYYECQSYIASYKPLQGRLGTCISLSAKPVYTLSHPTKVLKNQPPSAGFRYWNTCFHYHQRRNSQLQNLQSGHAEQHGASAKAVRIDEAFKRLI